MRTVSIAALAWLCGSGLALAQSASEPVAANPTAVPPPSDMAIHELGGARGGDDEAPRGGDRHGSGRAIQLFMSPSGEPFRAARGEPYPVAAWFARANTAHDGKLTRKEFIADAEAFFAKLDTNHDGVIDGFENQDYEQKIAPEILPRLGHLNAVDAGYDADAPGVGRQAGTPRRRRGGGQQQPRGGGRSGGPSYEGAAPYSMINEPQAVMGADTNFDGRITLDQWRKVAGERFDLLDKKKQGYLTLAELPKTPVQQIAEQMEAQRKNADAKGGGERPR